MKKNYIKPQADIFVVRTASNILVGSPQIQDGETVTEADVLTNEQTTSTNVWGEEW